MKFVKKYLIVAHDENLSDPLVRYINAHDLDEAWELAFPLAEEYFNGNFRIDIYRKTLFNFTIKHLLYSIELNEVRKNRKKR